MKKNNNKIFGLFILGFMFVLSTYIVIGAPLTPPTITKISDETRSFSNAGAVVNAQAGNVTAINIDALAQTNAWQGFYGNLTGSILLDNANNQSFYVWDLASPTGEVYASNTTNVNWSSTTCINFSNDGSLQGLNLTELNTKYGISNTDGDDFNKTFNETFTGNFSVGSTVIDSTDLCHTTYLRNDSGRNSAWNEVLLTDSQGSVIFTSIINDNQLAFDNSTADFQMLVAEDGHNGDTTVTPYYVYVEIV